jgi:DnaJ-class molecular chaperone
MTSGFASPNRRCGTCKRCNGTGQVSWQPKGLMPRTGFCFACRGTGNQTRSDIARNLAFNRHRFAARKAAEPHD